MLKETRIVLEWLAATPLLMKQHKGLPSVVRLVTGEDLRYSWWSHPQSRLLFHVMNELAGHGDVLICKLLFGKDTFVHRQLFPALLALLLAEDGGRLEPAARQLMTRIAGSARPIAASGSGAKALTSKLKVHTFEVHAASGRHELQLESWQAWARRTGVTPLKSLPAARLALDGAVARLGASSAALPFSSRTP